MIEVSGVSVIFRKGWRRKPIRALDDFSITIHQGDSLALLGSNGAGKSTAMYCLLGLIRPNKGYVRVFGVTPEPGSPLFRRITYVPEEPHYHLYLTVEEA